MLAISLEAAKHDLDGLIARVLSESEPIVLNTVDGRSAVVMPLDEFTSWQETAYQLRSPANVAKLRKSLEELQSGQVAEHNLDER